MGIQIGIELEFMVAHPSEQTEPSKKDLQDKRWPEVPNKPEPVNTGTDIGNNVAQTTCIYQVCEKLRDAGVPVACRSSSNPIDIETQTQKYGGEVHTFDQNTYRVWNRESIAPGAPASRFAFWFVTDEAYISRHARTIERRKRPKAIRGYEWYAVEISSPIISNRGGLQEHLPVVRKITDSLKQTTKIWVNSLCGFHIHASPSGGDLGLVQAKRVAAIAYLLEHSVLYGSCHPCRKSSAYCQPITQRSLIALGWFDLGTEDDDYKAAIVALREVSSFLNEKRVNNEESILKSLQGILSCADMKSLADGLSSAPVTGGPVRRSGLAISNYGTVEFRYPESSLDMDFILYWARLVRQIFAISSLDREKFVEKLAELYRLTLAEKPKELIEWLAVLDLTTSLNFLRTRLTNYRTSHKNLDKTGIVLEE